MLPRHGNLPQSFILDPLLFLLFINDIVTDIGSNTRLFTDDTSFLITVENLDTAAELLNLDLEKIKTWAKTWLVSFNPMRTESLLISHKLNKPVHSLLLMDNQVIIEVDSHKHLGSRGTKVEKMLTLAPERYTAGFCMVAKVILWCI